MMPPLLFVLFPLLSYVKPIVPAELTLLYAPIVYVVPVPFTISANRLPTMSYV